MIASRDFSDISFSLTKGLGEPDSLTKGMQRLKITVNINTNELKSESIKIKVEIQNFKNNIWSQPLTSKSLATQIEDNILNEARNLKLNLDK